ncbi:MAG: right-handed parallel beta-helix repeat-containing protein [Bacteroidetes bacterium]|nr:right-handed parallel beta-helix repeat-containing protein [Bacteroidota bacterium]
MAITATRVSATNYYLSSKGNDAQSGISALAPWRSLKKLSEVLQLLQPGDSILFDRGSIFAGELKMSASGKPGKEIYVGAYGSGDKPVITGSIEINNWTHFRGNIWVTDCSVEPGNLFMDGQYQPLGRYPNDGYMTLSCSSQCKTTLTDIHLAFADGYWDGSEVVVKSSRWTLDNLPISNYFNKTFYFSIPASYPLLNGYGYFIQKHLATLDKPGEWFFDKTSKKIFLYCNNDDKPANHIIEASVTDAGLEMVNVNFVTVQNMTFRYQRIVGAQIKYSSNVLLRSCQVEYSGNNGIEMISCQSSSIEYSRIENSNNNGVEWSDNSNGSFVRNSILCTGLHPGRGGSGNGKYIGVNITANNNLLGKNLFQYNSVDSTGYIGIDFRTGGTSIRNNLINNFCMIKDDGAGIYTWGNSYGDNIIEGNIIVRGMGSGAGTSDPDQLWVSGIYIDDRSSDIDIINNTVAYCGTTGIFIHNAKRLSIHGNKLFMNGSNLTNRENGQLSIKLDALVAQSEYRALELRVTENLFVTMRSGNHCIYLRAEKGQDLKALGVFDKNQYSAPHANLFIAKLYDHEDICDAVEELTLSDWQQETGNDNNSQFKIVDCTQNKTGTNLIKNSSMTNNIEGWMIWPSQVSITQDKKIEIDGPSLRVQFPSGKKEALLYHAGFSLRSNKLYRLSFSAMSTKKSKIQFAPLMASAQWEALDDYACFSIDTIFKSFTYFFKPNRSSKEARVNFRGNATFWIDNVTLSEVVPKTESEAESLQLIYNATENQKTIPLPGKLNDINGRPVSDPFMLPGYNSLILLRHQ